jgi:hypothetical protein
MAKNVKVKNTVLSGSVPNDIIGATALAPSATEGCVIAITVNTALVAIYPRTNFGNLYQRTIGFVFIIVCFLILYVHIVASKNDITPIQISIITLVITAAFYADPWALRRPSTTDALAEAAPSVFTLRHIQTPAASK